MRKRDVNLVTKELYRRLENRLHKAVKRAREEADEVCIKKILPILLQKQNRQFIERLTYNGFGFHLEVAFKFEEDLKAQGLKFDAAIGHCDIPHGGGHVAFPMSLHDEVKRAIERIEDFRLNALLGQDVEKVEDIQKGIDAL